MALLFDIEYTKNLSFYIQFHRVGDDIVIGSHCYHAMDCWSGGSHLHFTVRWILFIWLVARSSIIFFANNKNMCLRRVPELRWVLSFVALTYFLTKILHFHW
jgi:hypothetical protein